MAGWINWLDLPESHVSYVTVLVSTTLRRQNESVSFPYGEGSLKREMPSTLLGTDELNVPGFPMTSATI